MKKVLAVALLTVLFVPSVQAAPITVTAGDFLTFNFDLRGATPPPPYVLAGFNVQLSGLDFEPCDVGLCDLLDIGVWNFWTELNGTGQLFATHDVSLGGLYPAQMHDGVFSATLQMSEGEIVIDPIVCGITADGARTAGCPAAPPPPPAPEPATVGLLAIGGAVAMARRRRHRAL